MLVVSLIIVLGLLSVINLFKKPAEIVVTNDNFVCSVDENVVDNKHVVKDIKDEILFYANNINYRSREKIIDLLSKLQEYEDPGEFLDENPYICEYMFNRDVG